MSVLFVFLDGVGLAPAGPDNPLTDAPTPFLHALLGGPLVLETTEPSHKGHHEHREEQLIITSSVANKAVLFKAIDATLGVEGLPQSGTGQAALLAGINAARLHGRHQPHFPPVALRPILAQQNILRRVITNGRQATFANAFTPGYWEALAARRIRRTASVIAVEGAGIRFRTDEDLRRGEALTWDITGTTMRRNGLDIPQITPEQAGIALAKLARENDLVFYENFLPDLAGHGRVEVSLNEIFARIDGMLAAAVGAIGEHDTLVVSSDHGNIESLRAPTHTRNPVPLLAVGRDAKAFAGVNDISEIADVIEKVAR